MICITMIYYLYMGEGGGAALSREKSRDVVGQLTLAFVIMFEGRNS